MSSPSATVLITTKNRKEDLRVSLASCFTQTAAPEVLVIDDGSTDGTSDLVRQEFPRVRLVREEHSAGCVVRRNEGVRLASAPIVFSLDDDATLAAPTVVEQTLKDFENERIGAVAIPFCNVNEGPQLHQAPPDRERIWVTSSFIGTAHAVRRDLFLSLGGYCGDFVHQGEEGDYCLRMLASGRFVRLGRGERIDHFESPRRSYDRMDYFGCRNRLWDTWRNAPWPDLPLQLAGNTFNLLRHTIRVGRYRHRLRGIRDGWLQTLRGGRHAAPLGVFRLYRRLCAGPMRLDEAERQLACVPARLQAQ